MPKKILRRKKSGEKAFNSYFKNKSSVRSGIGPLKSELGETCNKDVEKAEFLNKIFASVFTCENAKDNNPYIPRAECEKLSNVFFNPDDILMKITVMHSCTNDNDYMISYKLIPIKYICVETSAFSNLVRQYLH